MKQSHPGAQNTKFPGHTRCVQDPLGLFFFHFYLQCHLLANCGVKFLDVSAVAVYNFKVQASLHHVF
jgi:hypothetical protein